MSKILAYGTLRKGHYNFDRFSEFLTYVETTKIKGFDLYDLGPYPIVVVNPEGEIEVDILEATEEGKRIIDRMEEGAGYRKTAVDLGSEQGTIYYYSYIPTYATKITSGNYNVKTNTYDINTQQY